ncbi:MAG TPA: hypothetical protein VNQ76_16675 [Planctomicrobium sp.]|nr:hypothetical protein [Planctomicrobium sp.]
MTNSSQKIHFGPCPLCEQGHILPARCSECDSWVVLCDECEAIWADPRTFQTEKPATQHPTCPHCRKEVERWKFPNEKQLQRYGIDNLIASRPRDE